jgi:hypothetical protein
MTVGEKQGSPMEFQTLQAVKPTIIRYALGIFWASFALDAGQAALLIPFLIAKDRAYPGLASLMVGFLLLLLVLFSIYALLIWKIGEGQNWARIAYLIIWLLLFVDSFFPAHHSYEIPVILRILGLLSTLLNFVGLSLIFGPGRHWFGSQRPLSIQWK